MAGVPDIVFPQLGNYPLSILVESYGPMPLYFKNVCNRLHVPYFYYYAFRKYVDFMEVIDMELLKEHMEEANRCLIDYFDIYDESMRDSNVVLFEYMVHCSSNVFSHDIYRIDAPERGPLAPPA